MGNERGFTLLEMLVALSILAVAALTLVRLDAFALRTAGDLDETSLAALVANNRAVEIWSEDAVLTVGASSSVVENAGREWRLEQRVSKTDSAAILRIDLLVRPVQGRGQAALTIIKRVS